ncbi:MAG: adenosylmethionine decarboxylase [Candidatus Omnitrophica bacterium]|nr:adenosylmethionine decarboxylase [Candidatus Omnitrophota bacterium]
MAKEYCCSNGHMKYAGTHLILEFWEAKNINSIPKIKKTFRDAIKACGATLLRMDMHKFTPYGGVSGMAIISESHFSIHSWPEYNYAAIDIFVCGTVDPYQALPALKKGFQTEKVQVVDLKRGIF